MNKIIEELYDKIDAQDKIINEQALEIARLKRVEKEYIYEHRLYEKEIKQLKEALLNIKKFIDKHTNLVVETGTKYLITSVKDDNELINIVNEALGDKENE